MTFCKILLLLAAQLFPKKGGICATDIPYLKNVLERKKPRDRAVTPNGRGCEDRKTLGIGFAGLQWTKTVGAD